MSVDTYLQRKNIDGYQRAYVDDVKLLVSQTLSLWAKTISLDVKNLVLWKSFNVLIEPVHSHAPGRT